MVMYTTNPLTGRKILIDGPAYNKLISENPSMKKILSKQEKIRGKAPAKRLHGKTTSIETIKQLKTPKEKTKSAKGWGQVAPKRGNERNVLYNKCGDKCFLMPETKNFPICKRLSASNGKCEVDCRGIAAAKIRSGQWKYKTVQNRINKIQSSYCSK